MEGKLSVGLFSPSSLSFNDNPIVSNFYSKKFYALFEAFQRFATNLKGIWIWSPLITEPRLPISQAYHSDYSVTEPIK